MAATSLPSRALAKREVQIDSTSTLAAFKRVWSLSEVISTLSSVRIKAAYEVASSDAIF
ncbi:hypothetical protein BC939DRAFT_445771, partial [Gamsiella multidivaricata]|uniref:uncharacterized protein n=1 Tax=Gamsiella multidivaricata TaxID=101098 RepID=UPI0022202AE2